MSFFLLLFLFTICAPHTLTCLIFPGCWYQGNSENAPPRVIKLQAPPYNKAMEQNCSKSRDSCGLREPLFYASSRSASTDATRPQGTVSQRSQRPQKLGLQKESPTHRKPRSPLRVMRTKLEARQSREDCPLLESNQ